MRKVINKAVWVLFVCTFSLSTLWAQAPQKMSYQAIIRNSSNALVVSGKVGMRISILQGSATGAAVYTETQTPTTNANGLVSIEIGGQAGFDTIVWASDVYFIKTETDPTGGTNYTITGSSQLLSVPYALYAKTAGQVQTNWTATSGMGVLLNKPANIDEDKTDDVTLTGNQTIAGNKTFTGTTTVATPVNDNDAATKAYVDALKSQILVLQAEIGLKDVDGNTYKAVKIGSQVWMAENLKTTKYADGTAIPLFNTTSTWDALTSTSKAYCWFNDDIANKSTYGALYTWAAAMNGTSSVTANPSGIQGVCPTGWHLPSNEEWTQLSTYLGNEGVAGGKLKETGTTHWISPNTSATNETGFTALPGGYRSDVGTFSNIGFNGSWWSATEYDAINAWYRRIYYNASFLSSINFKKEVGYSVRCVRD